MSMILKISAKVLVKTCRSSNANSNDTQWEGWEERVPFLVLFYWRTIALQCGISFCCTMKWISCMYSLPLELPSHPVSLICYMEQRTQLGVCDNWESYVFNKCSNLILIQISFNTSWEILLYNLLPICLLINWLVSLKLSLLIYEMSLILLPYLESNCEDHLT